MSETKTYTLGKIKQLIDLNGETTNFDLSFRVSCHDDTPFNMLVVDQTTLDNTPELEYKEVTREISGNILADKNIYQNYFLILKSDKQCQVNVEIDKKPLPKTPNISVDGLQSVNPSMSQQTRPNILSPSGSIPWKKIGLIILVVLIAGGILWYLYKRKPAETVNNDIINKDYNLGHYKPKMNFDSERTDSPFKGSPVNTAYTSPVHASTAYASPVHASPVHASHNHTSTARASTAITQGHKGSVHTSYKSPDGISNGPSMSSARSDGSDGGGGSLLYRLKRFASKKTI